MDIICLNKWNNDSCCGSDSQSYLHGVRITKGRSIIATHLFPFGIQLGKSKLIITENHKEYHYKVGEFTQTYQQIKDLIIKCLSSQFENTLTRKKVEYIVNDGDQSTFDCPLSSGESYAGANYYEVYLNGQQCSEGVLENEYIIVDGSPYFTVPITDLSPDDPNIINITYWTLS